MLITKWYFDKERDLEFGARPSIEKLHSRISKESYPPKKSEYEKKNPPKLRATTAHTTHSWSMLRPLVLLCHSSLLRPLYDQIINWIDLRSLKRYIELTDRDTIQVGLPSPPLPSPFLFLFTCEVNWCRGRRGHLVRGFLFPVNLHGQLCHFENCTMI